MRKKGWKESCLLNQRGKRLSNGVYESYIAAETRMLQPASWNCVRDLFRIRGKVLVLEQSEATRLKVLHICQEYIQHVTKGGLAHKYILTMTVNLFPPPLRRLLLSEIFLYQRSQLSGKYIG